MRTHVVDTSLHQAIDRSRVITPCSSRTCLTDPDLLYCGEPFGSGAQFSIWWRRSLVIEAMSLFSGLGTDVHFSGDGTGLQWEDYLFELQNAVEWRMVMSRGQDERSQMHAMSVLFNTCSGMTNRVLIDDGARWILQGDEQECENRAAGVKALYSMLAATTSGRATELVKQGLSERNGMIAFGRIRDRFGNTAGVAKLSDVFQLQWTFPDSLEDKWLRWQRLMRQVNMTSLGDDARETLTIAGLEESKERALEQHLRLRAPQTWTVLCASVDQYLRTTADSGSQPTLMEIGAVMSTCASCDKAGHEKARCRFRIAKCSNCGKTDVRQREKSAGKSSPSNSSGKSSGKGSASRGSTDKCYCCGQVGHRRPDCPRRNESCSLCGKRGHLGQVCRSSGGNANARAVDVDAAEPEEEREIQHVWALSVYDTSGLPLDALSVCYNFDLSSDESGNLLNLIMDSGAEEHVVSLADWKSLGEPVLKPAQVRLRSANGDDMGVSDSFMVRGWCDNQMVELTALVATRATRSLCSPTKLVNAVTASRLGPLSLFCVAVEAGAYCFNLAVSVISCQSE